MSRTEGKEKATAIVVLLNVLLVIALLAALISLGKMISELRRAYNRDPTSGMAYYLQEEDYAGMVREYYHRNYDIAPFPTPQEEEYHVAEYADAAFQDLFFRTVGDREMSARLEDRMKTAREQCGMLSVSADDVDELLKGISLYPQN